MKNLITFLLALSICKCQLPKGGKTNSRWNNYVTNPDAIPKSDFQFFKKGNLYYLTSNDDQNYYIDMRVEDTETEARILREGFVVWISTNNKQRKTKVSVILLVRRIPNGWECGGLLRLNQGFLKVL